MPLGIRRGRGCAACRRQKLKCDESQPICGRCLRLSRECEYPGRYQFLDENPRFGLSSDVQTPTVQATHESALRTELNVLSTREDQVGTVQKFQLVSHRSTASPKPPPESSPEPSSLRRRSASPLLASPSLREPERLAFALTDALKVGSRGHQLQILGNFILDIPSHLGHNPALDAAVACLLQSHSHLLGIFPSYPSFSVSKKSLPSLEYMRALRTLQEVIEHPVLGRSSETVCATILMGHYEMMVQEKRGSQYIAHAGAATKLIRVRGPKAISTVFETRLLRSQYGRIIWEAFLRREDCFLVHDDWQDIHFEEVQSFGSTMLNQFLRFFRRIPSLVKYIRSWNAGSTLLTMDQVTEYGRSLQRELGSISAAALVQQENENDLAFEEIPSLIDDNIFPGSLRFRTTEGAIFHTWCWTAFLILDLCMANLLRENEQRLGNSDEARHICMSYEFAAALKPLGVQFLQLPLIVTYSISSEEVKHWILRKINLLVEDLHISYEREYLETMAALAIGNLG